jgi:HAD superfamily hydrolase (TIGR01456 family)
LRSSTPVPGATKALRYLQDQRVPFILLTNGGGKSEEERVADLQEKLDVPLDTGLFVQSHTPFADYTQYHDKTVLVVGGNHDKCQLVAQGYGFKNVVTPGDIITAYPEIWPFTHVFRDYYSSFAKPLPLPIITSTDAIPDPTQHLKIDAIFVFSDPRDWGLDSAIILDTLLSQQGYIGTLSPKNGDESLPNNGYLQDSQPPLYYSNPDLWWASSYHLSRLGQGGFREAFNGLWAATTQNSQLAHSVCGKPTQETYTFAETRLRAHRKALFGNSVIGLNDPLRRVYMVGDNPASDIAGANGYESPFGSKWTSVLVKTGVWQPGVEIPAGSRPDVVKGDVWDAVLWAMEDAEGRR